MTWVAVMVVPLVVPSTRTVSPLVMALAEVEVVPFRYAVEGASSTVTFCPAVVDIVKLDVETLSTVPDAPPAAGPDRALDPPPVAPLPGPGWPDVAADGDVAVAEGDVPVAEGDAAQPEASPITADISAAATIHLLFPPGM
jgi:hypothetical protein